MWTLEVLVPPNDSFVPNARWAVPITFSSSRMLPLRFAAGFAPIPNGQEVGRPCRPRRACQAATSQRRRWPESPVHPPPAPATGSSNRPRPASEPSKTTRPSALPSRGAMNASPAGGSRTPPRPAGCRRPRRPRVPRGLTTMSVPAAEVTRDFLGRAQLCRYPLARTAELRVIDGHRAAEVSLPVMWGNVAILAPPRVASILARVWLSENVVAAKITAASHIAAATGVGGSSPSRVSDG